MIKYLLTKEQRKAGYIAFAISFIILIFGYFVLEYVSTKEKPRFGNTIYIFTGSTLIGIGVIGILVVLKLFYDTNKKRKRDQLRRKKHKLTFLRSNRKRSSSREEKSNDY